MAVQTQERFRFYLVALVFTILGLSIQTYDETSLVFARFTEVCSWAVLLVSGLAGLSYIEWGPILHEKVAIKGELEERVSVLNKSRLEGVAKVHVSIVWPPTVTIKWP